METQRKGRKEPTRDRREASQDVQGRREYWIAQRIGAEACTEQARALLAGLTLDQLLSPEKWVDLRFFAEIELDPAGGDTLPIRAQFGGGEAGYTMSVNPVVGPGRLWYTGYDLARSILLTKRTPVIRRAFRLVAEGTLPTLRAFAFRGAIPMDPRTDDIFRTVIEARHRVKRDTTLPEAQRTALQRGMKVFALSGSYGIFAESNPSDRSPDDPVVVRVHAGKEGFDADTVHPERPGEYCFPPIAALITSAARLLLGLIERLVTDRGGVYLCMDTDSMMIVATPRGGLMACPGGPFRLPDGRPAIRALSWAEVRAIVRQVDRLKPYGPEVRDPLLKIEAENYDPVTGKQVHLFGLALATKRYCLFVYGPRREIILRKRSDHGLGQLLDPMTAGSSESEEAA